MPFINHHDGSNNFIAQNFAKFADTIWKRAFPTFSLFLSGDLESAFPWPLIYMYSGDFAGSRPCTIAAREREKAKISHTADSSLFSLHADSQSGRPCLSSLCARPGLVDKIVDSARREERRSSTLFVLRRENDAALSDVEGMRKLARSLARSGAIAGRESSSSSSAPQLVTS